MTYEFTGRRAVAIWVKWALASAVAWLALHPMGATLQRDVLFLFAGGALASVLHGLVLWSRTLGQDVRLAWLVGSLGAWAAAAVVVVVAPWNRLSPGGEELLLSALVPAAGLVLGVVQWRSFAHLPRSRAWVPVPALALSLGFLAAQQTHGAIGGHAGLARLLSDPLDSYRFAGLVLGSVYGSLTATAFVWIGRGRHPQGAPGRPVARALRGSPPSRRPG
ncbi:MAG: hypothetical protein ACE5EL_01515 [Anaerolineae bacterium]